MVLDYYNCFRKSRVSNDLKKDGFCFTPIEKVYLIYNSCYTFWEKKEAFEEIINVEGDMILSAENAPGCKEVYGLRLGAVLKNYLNDRKRIIIKLKSTEPRTFYKAWLDNNSGYMDNNYITGSIPGYFATFDECIEKVNEYRKINADRYRDSYSLYIEKHYFDTIESPYDDAVIFAIYNEKQELMSVEECCTGIVSNPDPDVELLKQLDFDFLTPVKIRYRGDTDFI